MVSIYGVLQEIYYRAEIVSKEFETFITLPIRSEMYISLKLLSDRPSQKEKYLNIQLSYILSL